MSRLAPLLLTLIAIGVAPPALAGEAEALLNEADGLFRARSHSEALPLYEAAAGAADQEGDLSVRVEALSQAARMFSATGRLEEGRPALERAAALARPEEPLGWTRYLGVRGVFERESGDKAAALATFAFMYSEARRLDLPLRAIDAAHHAAIVAPPDEQIAWAHRGIAAAEAAGSEGWLAVLWNNLGATYDWDLEDYRQAVDCYRKARYFHHLGGNPRAMLVADWALGRAALLAGDRALAEELLPEAHAEAKRRLAAERTKDTLEWAGNTAWWHGELIGGDPGLRSAEALGHLLEAEENLLAAGIETWWRDGLTELQERIRRERSFAEAIAK